MLTFRAATLADVPDLVPLIESAYRGEASRAGWTSEADFLDGRRTDPEGVAELVEAPKSLVLMVHRGAELVSCCHLAEQGGAGYFGMFAVVPGLQGGGIGAAVLAEAERIARDEWGLTRMRMKVIELREPLIAWYERRGYRRTGERTPFPYGDERFGVPLRDDLEFVTLAKDPL